MFSFKLPTRGSMKIFSAKRIWRATQWLVRRTVVFAAYLCLFAIAYWLAFAFRFDFDWDNVGMCACYETIVYVVLLKAAVFFMDRHFHGMGLYATFKDLQILVKSSCISSCAFFLLTLFVFSIQLPRTVPVLDCIFTIALIGTVRLAWRMFRSDILPRFTRQRQRRVLLIGANEQGRLLADELYDHPELGYQIVGFITVHLRKVGRYIGQIPVLGGVDEMEKIIASSGIQEVLVLQGIMNGSLLRNVMAICQRKNVLLRIVPSIENRLGGSGISMRDINIEDLLKRKPIRLDDSIIEKMLCGKDVMITGAGGSIGSEICRQIIRFQPKTLVILGRGENRIFFLEKELRQLGFKGDLIPVIADVSHQMRMKQVFQTHQPHVVFHAAAHKHVPLMEANIQEAIRNNVLGTKTVSDLADQSGTETFVLVSTDKAVNPTSVMGASKHLAERYIYSFASRSKTKFIVTRFGNVLGSAGSVVPIFKKQIADGGPITVTDFRMTRYFMTIPEASQLVLQAGAMGIGGEIFVLDMGEPVRIVDLAKDLIRLNGLPENAIEIRETGMRPGEKLYEELYFGDEKAIPTSHPKLRCASHRRYDWAVVDQQLEELLSVVDDPMKLQYKLLELIEEYHPDPKTIPFSAKTKKELTVFSPASTEADDRRKTG